MVDPRQDLNQLVDDGEMEMDPDDMFSDNYQKLMQDLKVTQGSMHVNQMNPDDLPESVRKMLAQKSLSKEERKNICDIMYVGVGDESLTTYKERLLGNL